MEPRGLFRCKIDYSEALQFSKFLIFETPNSRREVRTSDVASQARFDSGAVGWAVRLVLRLLRYRTFLRDAHNRSDPKPTHGFKPLYRVAISIVKNHLQR